MALTIEEAMAMAVLKGDKAAAYALADRLIEELNRRETPLEEAIKETRKRGHIDGYTLYRTPEFVALANLLGIALHLPTTSVTITLPCDGEVEVVHKYMGMVPPDGVEQV